MNKETGKMDGQEPDRQPPLPMTVTSDSLIVSGSDKRFRELIDNLLLLSGDLQWLRSVLAQQLGVSEPQYRILMNIARLQDEMNVSVSALASQMRVTGAFVTAEAGKLHRMGLIRKEQNPADGRGVVLRLSDKGHEALVNVSAGAQAINDELFKGFSKEEFKLLSAFAQRLVRNAEWADLVARTAFTTDDRDTIRNVG